MEKIYKTAKKGRIKYRRGELSDEEMKVMEFLINNRGATSSQIEVGSCEMWVVRSMVRKGLVKEVGE